MKKIYLAFNFSTFWQNWYDNLCKDINEKFEIEDISKKNYFHITLQSNFFIEKDKIKELNNYLKNISKDLRVSFKNPRIDFFDDKKTVFLKADLNEEDKKKTEVILRKIKGLNFNPRHKEFPTFVETLHATLAKKLNEENFEKIFNFLKNIKIPDEEIVFDKIAIFIFDETKNKYLVYN